MGLKDYRNQIWNCVRCSSCEWVNPWEVKNAEFARVCPSSARYIFDAYAPHGRMDIARALIDGELEWSDKVAHIIYNCMMCGACDVMCKRGPALDVLDIWQELRIECVKNGTGPLPAHKIMAKNCIETGNVYGYGVSEKGNLDRAGKKASSPGKADIAYFPGCTASYGMRHIAVASSRVLNALGSELNVSMPPLICCGGILYKVGMVEEAKKLMEQNLDIIAKTGVKSLVFSCPHCYITYKYVYPKLGGKIDFKISHITELIWELIEDGRLELGELEDTVTYHDPCRLGRYAGVYQEPREILKAIPGLQFVEMDRIKENAWCCGGSEISRAFPDFSAWTAKERLREAVSTGATTLVTACARCTINLKNAGRDEHEAIQVFDITEVVLSSVRKKGGQIL
jgi:Fe-S oxidoreductase